MQRYTRKVLQVLAAAALLSVPFGAQAMHDGDPSTQNMHPLGHDEVPASLLTGAGGGNIHTDIAFWGRHAFQGSWLGFDIYDISAPGIPKLVSSTVCQGNQGDVVVWDDILVRSWNSPAGPGSPENCIGETFTGTIPSRMTHTSVQRKSWGTLPSGNLSSPVRLCSSPRRKPSMGKLKFMISKRSLTIGLR